MFCDVKDFSKILITKTLNIISIKITELWIMAKRLASFCLIYFIALHGLKAENAVSEQMPSDALIFFESEKISDFLVKVRDSDFFQSL